MKTTSESGVGTTSLGKGATLSQAFSALKACIESHALQRNDDRYYLVAALFFAFPGEPSVDDLFEVVRITNPNLQKSTVYKAMKLLEASGLAREKVVFGEESVRFLHVDFK